MRAAASGLPRPWNDESKRRWWILAAGGGSLAIFLLDEIMLGVALPTIRDDLDTSQLVVQWAVNAFVLAFTAAVAATGRLGDLLGHRVVLIVGAAMLAGGAIAAGTAQSGEWLIAGRAVMGLGTAGLFSMGIAMVGIAFAKHERGFAIGIYSLIGAAAAAIAPFLGGAITDLASWRWIFLMTVPLATVVTAIMAAAWHAPETAMRPARFDLRGLVLLVLFLVPLVLALMQSPVWGFASPAFAGLIVVSALALVAFVWVETRVSAPLIDFSLFRSATSVGSNLVIFCAQFTKMAVLVFGAVYLQDRLGMSALATGAALMAATAPGWIASIVAGRMTDRTGARAPILIGVGAMAISLVFLTLLVPGERYIPLVPGLLLFGFALPFFFVPPRTAIFNLVPVHSRGEASGVMTTVQMLGGALAIAVLGSALLDTDSYVLIFGITAGVTIAVWAAAFLLVERPARTSIPEGDLKARVG